MKKTAIVTGGSRGIGFGIVRQLGLDGYNVAVMDVNSLDDYKENFEELKRLGIDYLYVQGSTTDRADRERFLAQTVEKDRKSVV